MDAHENARRLRVQFPNALYHLTSRGVIRSRIYRDDDDRQAFFDRMSKLVAKYDWSIYAITLMSNHFHLFFRTPQPNLSAGAQYLLGHYARRFNRRWQLSGHLFEGRFRCHVVENGLYAWNASRYVHLNMVPHLVDHPLDWAWSSYRGYCHPEFRHSWIAYDEHLAQWSGDFGGNGQAYLTFVERGLSNSVDPFEAAEDGWILGSPSFAAKIRRLISPASNEPTVRRARLQRGVPLESIIEATCAEFLVPPEALRRKHSRHLGRCIVALLGSESSSATLAEIADALGLARRDSVPYLSKRAASAHPDSPLQRKLCAIRDRLELSPQIDFSTTPNV